MATQQKDRTTMIGVFDDLRLAQEAVSELKKAGFSDDQIGVIRLDNTAASEADTGAHDDVGTKAAEGAVTGLAAGASVGALWAIGIAAGMLPAVGPVIAGGLLVSILASAAGGAAVAGLVGALVGLGIPEEEARFYEEELRSGRTIVTVQSAGRHDEVTEIFERYGAYDMHNRNTSRVREVAGTAPRTAHSSPAPAASGTVGSDLPLSTAGAAATDTLAEERRLAEQQQGQPEDPDDITRRRPR